MTDIAFKTCPKCKTNYTTQNTCPRCEKSPQEPPGGATPVSSIPLGASPPKKQKKRSKPVHKAKSPRITKTTEKLTIPLAKHGELIYFIRWDISESVAIEKNRKRKLRAYWLDGDWHSELEIWFWCKWKATGLILPSPEYRFHPEIKWRFDFAFVDYKIAVEMEGGVHSRGRHTRGQGYKDDLVKYNEAVRLGWQLYRFADMDESHIEYMKARINEQALQEAA